MVNNNALPLINDSMLEDAQVDEEFNSLQLGDGIEVMVDAKELEEFDERTGLGDRSSSSEEEVMMVTQERPRSEVVSMPAITENDLANNPALKSLFEQFFHEKMKEMKEQPRDSARAAGGAPSTSAGVQQRGTVNKLAPAIGFAGNGHVKSPSDTTIYAPALTKVSGVNRLVVEQDLSRSGGRIGVGNVNRFSDKGVAVNDMQTGLGVETCLISHPPPAQQIVNQVSDFVEAVRYKQQNEDESQHRRRSEVVVPGLEQARSHAELAIIQAEKFKAKIATPPGRMCRVANVNNMFDVDGEVLPNSLEVQEGLNPMIQQSQAMGSGLTDDDFFHLTSHIDPLLKQKIERGEFVDLDKLLPKDRISALNRYSEDNRMEWVQRDDGTFLVPARKETRITNFRRWEQAFRMYATIYCGQNPHRAKEIWQYISVINTASSSFIWENVYSYDIVFRQLMAFNPNRSWAVTYNQMWNLSMREPIQRNHHQKGYGYGFNNGSSVSESNNKGKGSGQSKSKKPRYCWGFNKGVPCKFGKSCTYIERCSYCDSGAHGVNACPKLNKKEVGNNNHAGNAGMSAGQ